MVTAVLIPCHNEEQTIHQVVTDFRRELPGAEIHVFDNASTDKTAQEASKAGAMVTHEPRQGKGRVLRSMFRSIDADVYVLVDGDSTYPAGAVHELMAPVAAGEADMVVGDRLSGGGYDRGSQRPFHRLGNRLVRSLINLLFRADLKDIMSGYRVFSPMFVKTVPVMSRGFEVETELTLHALDKDLRIREIPVDYQERPRGSFSKLSTFSDGAKVLKTLFWIFKDFKPLHFFSGLALILFFLSLTAGSLPVWEYIQEQYVHRVPLAVLAVGLMILAMLFFSVGLVLDTVSKFHRLEHEMLVSRYMEMHRLRSSVDNSQGLKASTDEGRVTDPAGRAETSGRS